MKKQITLRIDEDVLDWFKSQGKGYQSKMNDALRSHFLLKSGKGYHDVAEYYDDIPDKIDNIISKVSINTSSAQHDYFKPMPKTANGKKR